MKTNSISIAFVLTAPYVLSSICCKLFARNDFYKSVRKGFDGHPLKAINDFYHKPSFCNFIDFFVLAVAAPAINYWALNSKCVAAYSAAAAYNLILCYESARGVAGVGAAL
jgi:hypothetical protein